MVGLLIFLTDMYSFVGHCLHFNFAYGELFLIYTYSSLCSLKYLAFPFWVYLW